MNLDVDSCEGFYSDTEEPGYFGVECDGTDILKVTTITPSGDTLKCEFEVLSGELTVEQIEELICVVLLSGYLDNVHLTPEITFIQFVNVATKEIWKNVYFG